MDLSWSAEGEAFRARLKAWLGENLDSDWHDKCQTTESYIAFQRDWDRRLHEGGWAGLSWPREHGGTDATPEQRAIFSEETARAHAPDGLATLGRMLVGPGIMKFGTEAQKAEFLQRSLSGELTWCQGFSEPEAGSDLASLRTRAVRDGDEYVINGSKIWTSRAHYASHCLLLVRTDTTVKKHAGITVLLIPMNLPGIEVRPLTQINRRTDFNQVFFTDVRVPVSARLGEEGQGWDIALYVLTHERGAGPALRGATSMEVNLDSLVTALDGAPLSPSLMRSVLETALARLLAYRVLTDQMSGRDPGSSGSIVKLFWTEAWQRMAEGALVEAGEAGLASYAPVAFADDLASIFLDSRRVTISGGTSEIQRNIIALRLLGLPKG